MTTRTVSPRPLSVFVPDVTLIAFQFPAFPIPGAFSPRGGRTFSSRESLFASRQENDLDYDIASEFRRKPGFALAEDAARVLDGCSRPRNQRLYQKFLIP
jgi:hypothetical protein